MEKITIKGARVHNLTGFDLEIPREKLVVITGVSGSGKSSLAFDTIYAEGQRRYVESLSAYARQFLEQMTKPDVESIEGLSPAIAIEQKTTSKNPRSTVGTVTEVYDYLRLLFARVGTPHCYKCGKTIACQSVSQITDRLVMLPSGSKLSVLSPVVRGRKGEYRKDLERLRREGYTRVRIDGEPVDLCDIPKLDKRKKHYIDVVVDRLIIKQGVRGRLAESLEIAIGLSGGLVKIEEQSGKNDVRVRFFNENLSCVDCGVSYPDITPTTFSFNSPHGACPECKGLGEKLHFDPDLVVPDKSVSLTDGAVVAWGKKTPGAGARQKRGRKRKEESGVPTRFDHIVESLATHYKFDPTVAFNKLPQKIRDVVLYGSGEEEIRFEYTRGRNEYTFIQSFEGVLPNLERRYHETESEDVLTSLEKYMNAQECHVCNGARLTPEALCIKINNRSIHDIVEMPVRQAYAFFSQIELEESKQEIAERIVKEITERLAFLINVGLDYLSLGRSAATLSGGEGQRIRLATQIGSSLVGVLYILDEPSIGLHQRDNRRLLSALKRLRDMGNTVICVEHDEATMRCADFIIDMGPGAGEHGGEVVATGPEAAIIANPKSITGKYLSGELFINIPENRKKPDGRFLELKKLSSNNLKDINVKIPIGLITCVTGVSGSGKSTLVIDTLYKNLSRKLYNSSVRAGKLGSIKGIEHLDKVIAIDQSPIGRTPRSNPATYTGLFTPIRELFSRLPDAQIRGYGPGRFSFNVKGGRCEPCRGEGVIKVEMHFLPDVYVNCNVCNEKRYNRETLEVRFRGKNIAECLDMTVSEGLKFFENIPHVREKLKVLNDVGLGYIRLGQAATTLSGGEAQRIKLAKELGKRATGKTLYILDEPTTGLHFADIQKLLDVLKSLSDAGNTIVIIEHTLDVVKFADHIIDLGPEGGADGGRIVATGTPEEVAETKGSHTGMFLKEALAGRTPFVVVN